MPLADTTEKSLVGRSSHLKVPPRPRSLNPLSSTLAFGRDPLSFLTTMNQRYGDIWQFRFLTRDIIVVNRPSYIKYVSQEKSQCYDKKAPLFETLRLVLGNGLLNTYGDFWLGQRRLIQPAFHRQYIAGFATTVVDMALDSLERWEALSRENQPIDVLEEMSQLLLHIMGKVMFSADINEQTRMLGQTLADLNVLLADYLHMPFPPLSVPIPRNYRLRKVKERLDVLLDDFIHQHGEGSEEKEDMLSMLLHATNASTEDGMSYQQLHDEILTLFIAGGETTAVSLFWVWYTLCQYPEVESALHEELDSVLGGRTPTFHDLPQLVYTRMIIDEVMRIYPAVSLFMRRAVENDEIDGYCIPKNTIILWSAYTVHRHPDYWEEPEQFRPERFHPEHAQKRARFSHIPFGGGPHICIGNNFALMEMTLIVATVAQRYRMEMVSRQNITPTLWITLRPSEDMRVYLRPRK